LRPEPNPVICFPIAHPMKTKLLLVASLGLVVGGAFAADAGKPVSPVAVTFVAREKFTDVRDDFMESEKGRDAILDDLKDHLVKRGTQHLVAGQRLEISVTDVDLAGDFEPWRGINFQDIRVVKDIYPPRVDLEFRLVDAEGKVVSEGKRQLRDMGYLMNMSMPTTDPLRHDKEMLSDWLSQEFKRSSS
jgi:hypothetical protein